MEQMKNVVTALTLQVGREGGREGGGKIELYK